MSDTLVLRGVYFNNRNAYIAAEEPAIFHCHHYNTYLQAVLEDASSYLDTVRIMKDASHEIAFDQFSTFFRLHSGITLVEKIRIVEDFYRFSGFGILSLAHTSPNGGEAIVSSEHYGVGWESKFGLRESGQSGVGYFATGFITGVLEAIYGYQLGELSAKQTHCISKGDLQSKFKVEKLSIKRNLMPSPKEGMFQMGDMKSHPDSGVNYEGIREALTNMPLEGDATTGLMDAFGVLLTRMYANYYTIISYRFLKAFEKEMGKDGLEIARQLLIEAGHNCAYNTFGGIMQSMEWNGMIKPMLKSKEDWIHGIVAVVNAFGWGIWEIVELVPQKKLVLKITSGYESNSYLKQYATSDTFVSFLATGGVAGIMNLIYNTPLTSQPITLDTALYNETCAMNSFFQGKQLKCRAMGDDFDLFEATCL